MSKMPKLVLIDGYGFVFRAYHSLPPLTRPDGTPVGAVYGFTNMLYRFIAEFPADYMAVILDAGRKTFRHDLYDAYKANRPPPPEDLVVQFPMIRTAAEALSLPVVEVEGYEADDVIATYAKTASRQGMEVVIASSDKDLMQLIDAQVMLYDPLKSREIRAPQVEEKFGVGPDKLLDVLSLMGDSSDNVPGVPGIGPKTAAELIGQWGNLDEVLAHASEVPQKKRREMLETHAEDALLSRKLITLCETVPVPRDVASLVRQPLNEDNLLHFVQENGFKSLAARIGKAANTELKTQKTQAFQFKAMVDADNQLALAAWVKSLPRFSHLVLLPFYDKQFSLEYVVLLASSGDIIKVAVAEAQTQSVQGDLFAAEEAPAATPIDQFLHVMQPLFSDPSVLVISHNIKRLMRSFAVDSSCFSPFEDVMLMSYVLESGQHGHEVVDLAERYLEQEVNGLKAALKEQQKTGFSNETLGELAQIILEAYGVLKQRLFDQHLLTLYYRLEKPLIPVVAEMERKGVRVDPKRLASLSQDFQLAMTALEKVIYQEAGEEFNIASPKQLGELLFEKMGIQAGKKSRKTGAYSTSAEVLTDLVEQGHSIAQHILEWRGLSKLKSTYSDKLPHNIAADGRVHTHYSLAATTTGRLSSHDPNLQNIPIRTVEGQKIREAFIPEPGNCLLSADYSQIELRLLAHVANIETLKQAFATGADIHAATASQVFGVASEQVDAELRRRAKAINFGIIYGLSAFGLAARLGIGRGEAKEYIERYFDKYPGIRRYIDDTLGFARQHGYVTTLFGRVCHIPALFEKNPARRQFGERAATNAPLQGAGADIIKKAMVAVAEHPEFRRLGASLLLQVHDELVVEVAEKNAEAAAALLKRIMENIVQLSVPLVVEVGIGKSWAEIH